MNDARKCVEVDNDETLYAYVKHHRDADGWRGKPFPRDEEFSHIFGVDRAIGKAAKVPAEITNEVNEGLGKLEKDGVLDSRIGLDQQSTSKSDSTTKEESAVTRKRRKEDNDDNITRGLDKFAATFKEVMETSNEQIRLLVESFQTKVSKKDEVKARNDELWTELLKLDLSVKDRIKALKILMSDDADLFLDLFLSCQ